MAWCVAVTGDTISAPDFASTSPFGPRHFLVPTKADMTLI